MNYIHLTIEERACISKFKEMKLSLREIAKILNRNVSTISRELKRNSYKTGINYSVTRYVPVNNETGEVVSYMKKTECIVILTYNAELWCKIENNFYILVEIENRDTTMKKEIDNDKPIERKTVIPPKSHPWRKNMMLR